MLVDLYKSLRKQNAMCVVQSACIVLVRDLMAERYK